MLPGKDGLVHISELADFRVNRTEDVVKIGDMIWVKCIGVDDKGRVKLSRKAAMKERDEAAGAPGAPAAPRLRLSKPDKPQETYGSRDQATWSMTVADPGFPFLLPHEAFRLSSRALRDGFVPSRG